MRGVFRSEPKFLAIVTSLNAMCFSVRTRIPGGIPLLGRDAFFGQNRNSWRISSLNAKRYAVRTEIPGGISSLNERRFSVSAIIPGGIYQFECEAFFGQDPNSWLRVPV